MVEAQTYGGDALVECLIISFHTCFHIILERFLFRSIPFLHDRALCLSHTNHIFISSHFGMRYLTDGIFVRLASFLTQNSLTKYFNMRINTGIGRSPDTVLFRTNYTLDRALERWNRDLGMSDTFTEDESSGEISIWGPSDTHR